MCFTNSYQVLNAFISTSFFNPDFPCKGFCTTRHFLSACCNKTCIFHTWRAVSSWNGTLRLEEKKKCCNISFALTFKYSWICRAHSFAPSPSPFLWFYMDLNYNSFFPSLTLLSFQFFHWVLCFYIKLKFIAFYFPHVRQLYCNFATGVFFFYLLCSALIPDTLGEVPSPHFTSKFLYYWIVLSDSVFHVVAMSLLWNFQRLIGHQENPLISIPIRYIYFEEPDSLTNALSARAKLKSSALAYLSSFIVSTLYCHSFISWALLGGELFKARAVSWLYLCA